MKLPMQKGVSGVQPLNISTGIDIVDIKRFEETLKRYGDRFIRRIFTEKELKNIPEKDKPYYMAASFSFKEAIWKALPDSQQRHFYFRDIEILWKGEKPSPLLKGNVLKEITIHFFSTNTTIITVAILITGGCQRQYEVLHW